MMVDEISTYYNIHTDWPSISSVSLRPKHSEVPTSYYVADWRDVNASLAPLYQRDNRLSTGCRRSMWNRLECL